MKVLYRGKGYSHESVVGCLPGQVWFQIFEKKGCLPQPLVIRRYEGVGGSFITQIGSQLKRKKKSKLSSLCQHRDYGKESPRCFFGSRGS